jgi:alkylation response protein AidB-like acyl-CoA dehydrogenase
VIEPELDEELALLRETARGFAESWLRPRERDCEAAREVAPEAREAFAKIGLAGLELPERLGGAGLGAVARAVVGEELAAGDPGAALALDPLGPALYALAALGEERLGELATPLLREPGARAVLVFDEHGELAVEDGRVRGRVPWVPAGRVDLLAAVSREALVVVREGIALEPVRGSGLRAAGASALRLEGAPLAGRLREPEAARRVRTRARLYGAALLVGIMRAAAERSRSYALEREAFGRPIAHHQALAFLIADLFSAVEGTRWLVLEAAWRLERGVDAAEACATAFLESAEQAMFVTPNALQILGGHGFMQDHPLEKWMREARALGLLFGGVDAAREEAGAELAGRAPPVALTLETG